MKNIERIYSERELIHINGIREDLYQAMQIGDITLNAKISGELYDFMNYQDKEIERLKEEREKLYGELQRYKSIVYLCEKVKDCDKE